MFRFAFANLISRPGRTALSVLGLTIAIAGMVGLFSIAGGIDALMEQSFGDIDGVVVLQNGAPIPLFSTLPAAWGEEIATVDGVHVVTPEYWSRANLIDGVPIISPPRLLLGTDLPSWLRRRHGVYTEAMIEGRFLTQQDVGTNRTVISRQIAEEFEKSIGDPIVVNGRELEIVGLYEVGSILLDTTIIVDIDLLRQMTHAAPDAVSAFYLEADEGVDNEAIVSRIETLFEGRELPAWKPGGLLSSSGSTDSMLSSLVQSVLEGMTGKTQETGSPDGPAEETRAMGRIEEDEAAGRADSESEDQQRYDGPIQVQSVVEWSNQFQDLTADLDIILTLLTAIGVAIAVSSILNTMLMSVTERIVEFGILRANGWSQGDIVKLITCEAAMIGIAGGVTGVLCGWIATQIINHIWADRINLYAGPGLLTGSLLFAVIVGMLGGLYPALRAARMSPMEAIRRG